MRRIGIVVATAALVVAAAPVARAGGGGMCFEDQSSSATDTAVTLVDSCFNPTIVYVRPGETVTWHNKDHVAHTVTGMPGTFDSKDIQQGQQFTYTFNSVGTYAYYCFLHRRMAGAVVVAGDISKVALGAAGSDTGTGTGAGDSTPVGSKSSSAALPLTALAIAVPVAAGLGFGAGRRKMAPPPLAS